MINDSAFASSPRGMRNMRDEQSMYPTVFEQARSLTSLGSKPLVVVTATESIDKHEEWTDLQDRLAALSTNSQLTPSIDATDSLDEAPDAMRQLEAGTVRGKVCISVQ